MAVLQVFSNAIPLILTLRQQASGGRGRRITDHRNSSDTPYRNYGSDTAPNHLSILSPHYHHHRCHSPLGPSHLTPQPPLPHYIPRLLHTKLHNTTTSSPAVVLASNYFLYTSLYCHLTTRTQPPDTITTITTLHTKITAYHCPQHQKKGRFYIITCYSVGIREPHTHHDNHNSAYNTTTANTITTTTTTPRSPHTLLTTYQQHQ
ncbi:hypothetical protein E2C01_054611 [Portunus trituberculatus]|uniref:Uncharacterized protein n=1 Tax=Portunus trituberculatus TaxID=210409 RepID=A0A5B7GP47_PORTR|nr:hypothetical protein [Portunus trituberculatus]